MQKDGSSENSAYVIRPNHQQKFRQTVVKDLIHEILNEQLADNSYTFNDAPALTKTLNELILTKLQSLDLQKYKFISQVLIGEQRGEGISSTIRCLWDSDTDNYAHDIFISDSFFCLAAVYAIFYY